MKTNTKLRFSIANFKWENASDWHVSDIWLPSVESTRTLKVAYSADTRLDDILPDHWRDLENRIVYKTVG